MSSKFHRSRLHFLFNLRTHHNSLIGGENHRQYAYMTLTHSRLSGHKKNLKLKSNPNRRDPSDAYLVKQIFVDDKDKFEPCKVELKLSDNDETSLEEWFNNNKLFKQ